MMISKSYNENSIINSYNQRSLISIGVRGKDLEQLKEICTNIEKKVTDDMAGLPEQIVNKVVDAVVTKFEEDIIPKFVKEVVDETGNKITEMQTTIKEWHDDSTKKINKILDEVATIVAGQEAQGKDLKELLKNKEKQDEINRRLDLYMTSTEAAIAENTKQLKNVEKMLLLKEEKDRKDFDAVKEGIEGLAKNNDEIKGKIGGLLKEETAFQEFQKLWDHNNYIKQQNDDIKQQNDYIKTLLINLADNVYKQDEDKKNKIDKINSVISNLEDKLTTLNDNIKNAIAASDAKLLGMIMPEFAAIKVALDKQAQGQDSLLQSQAIQTTILNSILSGQQDSALQYVAMSEKLDNLTELVSALGTRMQNQSFDDNEKTNVVELLENFAKSQEAAFAAAFEKVVKKDDLKHLDTGIDSIIEKLHDDSVKLNEVRVVVENMAKQITSIADTGKNNSKKLDDIHKILLSSRAALDNVADCDRCHSADSRFYKCQICGYDGKSTNIAPNERGLSFDQTEGLGLLTLTPESNGSIIIDACVRSIAASISSAGDIQQEVKKYRNSARKIVFDACVRGEKKCQNCEREINIVLYDQDGYAKTAKNILEYFPNLEVVSFAKPLDGKPQYILTSGLFYDTTEEQQQKTEKGEGTKKKHTALQYYGGQYIREMKKGVFNIPDVPEEAGRNFLLKLDPNEGLLNRIREISKKPGYGKGYWRK